MRAWFNSPTMNCYFFGQRSRSQQRDYDAVVFVVAVVVVLDVLSLTLIQGTFHSKLCCCRTHGLHMAQTFPSGT